MRRHVVALVLLLLSQSAVAGEPKIDPDPPGTLALTGSALNEFLATAAKRQSFCADSDPIIHWRYYYANDSRLVTLRENDVAYCVAIQTGHSGAIPGIGEQQIVLLKPSGEILDRIQCEMTIKLGTGNMTTEACRQPEPDGAQFIVRYQGRPGKMPDSGREIPTWLHEMHDIVFRGKDNGFEADNDFLRKDEPSEPNIWAGKGLCRIKVSGGKLCVLFPNLEDPEKLLHTAVSLRVKYSRLPWGGDWKTEVFDDRKEVKELVSSISIQRTLQVTSGTSSASTLAASISVPKARQTVDEIGDRMSKAIELYMPDGRVMTVAFHKDGTRLTLFGWGYLDLRSKDFYDKLSALVEKRVGKSVELANEYN